MTERESRAESLLIWIYGWIIAPSLWGLCFSFSLPTPVSTCREQPPNSFLWVPPAPALPKPPVIFAQRAPQPRHRNQAQLPYRKGMGFCSILNRIHLCCTSVWGEEHTAPPLLASTQNAAQICLRRRGVATADAEHLTILINTIIDSDIKLGPLWKTVTNQMRMALHCFYCKCLYTMKDVGTQVVTHLTQDTSTTLLAWFALQNCFWKVST